MAASWPEAAASCGRRWGRFAPPVVAIPAAVPWALSVILLVLTPLLGLDMVGIGEPPVTVAAAGMLLAAIAAGQVMLSRAMRCARPAGLYWLLAVQVILTFLPALLGQQVWVIMPGLLFASSLLALRGLSAFGACALVLVAQVLLQATSGQHAPRAPLTTVAIVGIGIGLRVLVWLARAVAELGRNQLLLADVAVRTERLRFSRDLHDTLVRDLTVIGLRGELAMKLLPPEADQVRAEIGHIIDLARSAVTDARAVAGNYRRLSVQGEIDRALSDLAAAGISCTSRITAIPADQAGAELFAWTIREGTSNILRHSKAGRCTVQTSAAAEYVTLELISDGAAGTAWAGRALVPAGSGLTGLAERTRSLGGQLECGVDGGGQFWLRIDLPVRQPLAARAGEDKEHAPMRG